MERKRARALRNAPFVSAIQGEPPGLWNKRLRGHLAPCRVPRPKEKAAPKSDPKFREETPKKGCGNRRQSVAALQKVRIAHKMGKRKRAASLPFFVTVRILHHLRLGPSRLARMTSRVEGWREIMPNGGSQRAAATDYPN